MENEVMNQHNEVIHQESAYRHFKSGQHINNKNNLLSILGYILKIVSFIFTALSTIGLASSADINTMDVVAYSNIDKYIRYCYVIGGFIFLLGIIVHIMSISAQFKAGFSFKEIIKKRLISNICIFLVAVFLIISAVYMESKPNPIVTLKVQAQFKKVPLVQKLK